MLLLYLTLATRYLDSLCCDFVTERTWLEAGDLLLPGVQMRPRCDLLINSILFLLSRLFSDYQYM